MNIPIIIEFSTLDNPYILTLTIDGWSSRRRLSFIGIICHMMLEGCGMTEAALHCHYFRGSHNAKKCAQVLLSTIMKWKLGSKLVCIGTDNDSSILKACRHEMELNCVEDVAEVELITDGNDENSVALLTIECDFAEVSKKLLEAGDGALPADLRQKGLLLFHYRCANHLMNLAVGDFFKSPLQGRSGSQLLSLIGKARKWCICVKNSSLCAEVFHTHHFNIVAMNETRWNKMYSMISSIVDNKGKLYLLPEYPKSPVPSAHEIRILEEVREALAPAVEFTKLQEKGSSTSGMLLCALEMLAKKLVADCSDLCKTFSNVVVARFSDPCSDPFYKIAALLDPRCCYFYKDNAEYRELLNSAIGVVQAHREALGVSASTSSGADTLPPLKKSRGSIFDCMPTIPEPEASTASTGAYDSFVAESMGFFMKMDTDVGQFGALNEAKLPILAELAKVYVLAPTSTSEVERLFSVAGRVASAHRSSLLPRRMENLVILKHREKLKAATQSTYCLMSMSMSIVYVYILLLLCRRGDGRRRRGAVK